MRSDWNTALLGDIASVAVSGVDKHVLPGERPVRLCNYLDVYRNRRLTKPHEFSVGSATQSEVERFRIQKGDVIITKDSETPDDIAVPCLIAADFEETICGYHLALIRPGKHLDSGFLSYLFQSEAAQSYFLSKATGLTRFGLGVRAIASFQIPLPPPGEQATIACVLDAVDTALERTHIAIEKAQRLKHGLMQQLLPPWFGVKHVAPDILGNGIEVLPASSVARVANGSTPSRAEPAYWRAGTIPWLATGKVNDRVITEADEYVTDKALAECSIELLPPGTVLVGMIGQGKTRGMTAYLSIAACINQNFGAFVPGPRLDGKYLCHYFSQHYSPLREIGGGTNQGALNCYILKRIRIPVPPIQQQRCIAEKLDACAALISRYGVVLEKLERLKRGLMQDLLTGKRRVVGNALGRMKRQTLLRL